MIRMFIAALAAVATAAAAQPVRPPATTAEYRAQAVAELARLQAARPIERRAKNVIIFIGDGMGVSTLTAARIHQGQRAGLDGPSFVPVMDRLDHTALVKTYGHDVQVVDSAPSATAILAGVKTGNGVIGIGPEAPPGDCAAGKRFEIPSIMALAQQSGRATGIISTARITHATPAATYAHAADRDWEADGDLTDAARRDGCTDIARQLVEGPVGRRMDVILGGGRRMFVANSVADAEYPDRKGSRTDGRNLIADWQRATGGRFVWNARDFAALDPARDRRVLGLFEPDHMQYEADRARDRGGEPSIAAMTRTAIATLGRNRNGFVLMIEGGRIDHAHHGGNARRALEDTIAFDDAIRAALDSVDLNDTLVLVTADHSHVFNIAGYPGRDNPILGVVAVEGKPSLAADKKPYTTLSYANGPGAVTTAPRPDPSASDTTALDYKQPSLIPLGSETHGGEDVVVRASGPMAHLFRGTIEQHTIYHIVREAMIEPRRRR